MRLIQFIALLCLVITSNAQEQKKQFSVYATTEWNGRPRCNGGRGLCAINIVENKENSNSEILVNSSSQITIKMDASKFESDIIFKITGVEDVIHSNKEPFEFALDEDFPIGHLLSYLELPNHITKIKKDLYKISGSEGYLYVTFMIK